MFQASALVIANLPKNTALGSWIHAPFTRYLQLTAQDQQWNMFVSRPAFLALEPHVIATWNDGAEQFPPLLPGPAPYRDALRLEIFFARVSRPDSRTRATFRYAQAMCRAITAQTGREPDTVQVVLTAEVIQTMSRIRRTGVIANRRSLPGRPVPCR